MDTYYRLSAFIFSEFSSSFISMTGGMRITGCLTIADGG